MVSGINVNNYSAAQLQELQKAGMQISNEDIKAAQEREAQQADAKASDEAQVDYTISDDASEVNEAEQEVAAASEYGASLKNILQTLIPKCFDGTNEMAALQTEMDKFVVSMEDLGNMAGVLADETEAKMETVEAQVEAEVAVVEEKQAEIAEQTEIVEEVVNNEEATEADMAKAEEASENIEALDGEVAAKSDKIADMQAKAQSQIQQTAITKATLLGKSMEDVKNQAEASLNSAINANEYADVTIDKGTEATEISSRKEARKAGFKGGFFGLSGSKKDAHRMGTTAIVAGSELGNATKGIGETVKQVGSQFGMSFAETSGVEALANKEYADTSSISDLQGRSEHRGLKGMIENRKAAKHNRGVLNSIADEAKALKKGATEPEAAPQGTTEA